MSHRLVSRSKIQCVVSQELYKWCHSNICSGVHKKCKIQVSTIYPNTTLCIKRCTPFMEIDDKGGEIETKILQMGIWTWTMDKDRATLRNWEGSKFLDKRITQVGGASSWTCLFAFDLCIVMCLLALHKFLNLNASFVWCMLVVELEWWLDN